MHQTSLSWLENFALKIERIIPLAPWLWGGLYAIAALFLSIPVIILTMGTGVAIYAYISCGLYASDGFTAHTVLFINLFSSLLGWFICCWWWMLLKLIYHRFRWQEYRSKRSIWFSGTILFVLLSGTFFILTNL